MPNTIEASTNDMAIQNTPSVLSSLMGIIHPLIAIKKRITQTY